MKNKIVIIDYDFASKETSLSGQLFVPIYDGHIYKPIRATILRGQICDNHNNLTGANGEENRKFKNMLIRTITKESGIGIYRVTKPFVINENIGIVKFASLLSGFNTNKSAKIMLDTKHGKYNGALLGKLFKNPKSLKSDETGYYISFDELIELNEKPLYEAFELYDSDFKSITTLGGTNE